MFITGSLNCGVTARTYQSFFTFCTAVSMSKWQEIIVIEIGIGV
ncbi:hypothetical protein RISW2_22990 [Roseivivax isoporae LMG 25204]|uniref:Uncharacterized protein n=1 Tax=Roseivivax isoporae LMG 25204 TaxID=1449351 RepID=X7F1D1_9RHOB|nr:hypothetical protein RISW2_22990 [Roseivivax isoporae LMG 25204]